MRAVNLIPDGSGPGSGSGSPAGSGFAVYGVLAGLAVLVAMVALWTTTSNQISGHQAVLERANAQAQAAQARATVASPYSAFSTTARNRVATVVSLSATRFDWAHAMREISRVLPADTYIETISGSSGASEDAPVPGANATPAPSFDVKGCTTSQTAVALLLARLRTIDGIASADLKSSDKPGGDGGAAGNSASGGDAATAGSGCGSGRDSDPSFELTVSFKAPSAPAPTAAGATPAPAGATPVPPSGAPGAATPAPAASGSASPPAPGAVAPGPDAAAAPAAQPDTTVGVQ